MSNNFVVVTGFIGAINKNFKIHPAPIQNNLFFSNNLAIKNQAISKKWTFIHLPDIPLTNNLEFNSVQSKKLKFLQLPGLKKFDQIIWVDHKRKITFANIVYLLNILKNSPKTTGVIIRSTPKGKNSIWQEYYESNLQKRYRKHANITRKYINTMLTKKNIKANKLIANTGLILYNLKVPGTLQLVNRVFECIRKTGNPMCQIFWMLESQQFPGLVKMISYKMINI